MTIPALISQILVAPLTRALLDDFAEYVTLPYGWSMIIKQPTKKFHCFATFAFDTPTVLKSVGFSASLTAEIYVENLEYIGTQCGNSVMKCLQDVQKLVEQIDTMVICKGITLAGENQVKLGIVRLPDCGLLIEGNQRKIVRCDRCTAQQEVIAKNLSKMKRRMKNRITQSVQKNTAEATVPSIPVEPEVTISAAVISRLVECGLITTSAGTSEAFVTPVQGSDSRLACPAEEKMEEVEGMTLK